jgi:tripartite-type tricarboxylate transporter receptor subunit TctC
MLTRQHRLIAILILLLLVKSVTVGWCASQSDVAAFFEGKRMTIIVPVATGTGFDIQARILAPFLEKYLKVKAIIKNVPGGGQLIGDNEVYRSNPDGLTLGYIYMSTMVTNEIGETPGRDFELLKFSWVAQVLTESFILCGRTDLPTFQELVATKRPLIYGSPTEFCSINGDVICRLFNLPWKIVKGFLSTPEMNAALIRNEVQVTAVFSSSLGPWIKAGDYKGLLVLDSKPWNQYPELPTLLGPGGLVSSFTGVQLEMAKGLQRLGTAGRAIAGPPGIPQERLLFLKAKLNDVLKDEDFLKQFEKQTGDKLVRLPFDQFMNLLNDAVRVPPELQAIIKPYFGKK